MVFSAVLVTLAGGLKSAANLSASFMLEAISHLPAGTVDYIREMANNKRGGAHIRVTPRPLWDGTITMTVPVAANTNDLDVASTAEQELAGLIRLARPQNSKL